MHFPFVDIAYYVEIVFRITDKESIDKYNNGERPIKFNRNIHKYGHDYKDIKGYGYIVYDDDYDPPSNYYDMNALLQELNVRYGFGEYDPHPDDGLVVWFVMCDILIKPLYRDPEVFDEVNIHLINRFLDGMDKVIRETPENRKKKINEIWS